MKGKRKRHQRSNVADRMVKPKRPSRALRRLRRIADIADLALHRTADEYTALRDILHIATRGRRLPPAPRTVHVVSVQRGSSEGDR